MNRDIEEVAAEVERAVTARFEDRITALEAELARLRPAVEGTGPAESASPPPANDSPVAGVALSRRGLLGAAAGAVAAGAVGMAATASPAAATNGNYLVLGTYTNSATGATAIVTTGHPGYSFGAVDTSFGGSFATNQPAVLGYAAGNAANVGGWFVSDVTQGVGMIADANGSAGTGVRGSAPSGGIGVEGIGGSMGVHGQSGTTGIIGECTGPIGTGVSGSGPIGTEGIGAHYGISGLITGTSDDAAAVHGQSGLYGVAGEFVGDVAQLRLAPANAGRAAPTGDNRPHRKGELLREGSGTLWLCVADGTPGSWRTVAGPSTAGALWMLPAPVRVYDSRPGFAPHVSPQTPLAAGVSRVLDLKVNNSGVPAGATAALVTCLIVNAVPGNGNFTIWANLVAKPASNSTVWGGSTGRTSSLAVSAVDAQARVQVASSIQTDFVLDVVGYYH